MAVTERGRQSAITTFEQDWLLNPEARTLLGSLLRVANSELDVLADVDDAALARIAADRALDLIVSRARNIDVRIGVYSSEPVGGRRPLYGVTVIRTFTGERHLREMRDSFPLLRLGCILDQD